MKFILLNMLWLLMGKLFFPRPSYYRNPVLMKKKNIEFEEEKFDKCCSKTFYEARSLFPLLLCITLNDSV